MRKQDYYYFMLTMSDDEINATFNYNVEYIIQNQIDEDVLRWALQREGQYLLADDEIFVRYPGYNHYYGSNYGRVISIAGKEPKFLKQSKHNRYDGYTFVEPDKPRLRILVGRMVADIFCPNFYREKGRKYVDVHHIDHDKTNNCWRNLVLLPDHLHDVVHRTDKKCGIMQPFVVCVSPLLDGDLDPNE